MHEKWIFENRFFETKNILGFDVTLIGSDKFFPLSSSTTLIAIDYGLSTYPHLRNTPTEKSGLIKGFWTIGFP